MVYENPLAQGGKRCFTQSDFNLSDNYFDNNVVIDENISVVSAIRAILSATLLLLRTNPLYYAH